MEKQIKEQTTTKTQPTVGFDYQASQTKTAIINILNDSGLPLTCLDSMLFEIKTTIGNQTQRSIQAQKEDYEKQLEAIKLVNSPTSEEFKKDSKIEGLLKSDK